MTDRDQIAGEINQKRQIPRKAWIELITYRSLSVVAVNRTF